jgi:hypothetical protein
MKIEPFTIDLNVGFEYEGVKMEFTVLKAWIVRSMYADINMTPIANRKPASTCTLPSLPTCGWELEPDMYYIRWFGANNFVNIVNN